MIIFGNKHVQHLTLVWAEWITMTSNWIYVSVNFTCIIHIIPSALFHSGSAVFGGLLPPSGCDAGCLALTLFHCQNNDAVIML